MHSFYASSSSGHRPLLLTLFAAQAVLRSIVQCRRHRSGIGHANATKASGSASTMSPAIMPISPFVIAGDVAGQSVDEDARAGPLRRRRSFCARSAAITPVEHVARASGRHAGVARRVDVVSTVRRSRPCRRPSGPRRAARSDPRQLRGPLDSVRLNLGDRRLPVRRANSPGMRRQDRRGESHATRRSVWPTSAFRPSASMTSGFSVAVIRNRTSCRMSSD